MAFESSVAYNTLHPHFQERVHLHEPLASHSSFGVGGPADIWLSIEKRQELHDLVSVCAQQGWPLLVVGAGSNILYADAGVRGVVASMATQNYHLEDQSEQSALVVADAGVRWQSLLKDLLPLGWGGLEFALNIPGTLGAGIISNVGTRNQNLGQAIEWIEVLDARNCNSETNEPVIFPVLAFLRYQKDELDLSYRHSRFRNQRLTYIDTQGQFVLTDYDRPAHGQIQIRYRSFKKPPGWSQPSRKARTRTVLWRITSCVTLPSIQRLMPV